MTEIMRLHRQRGNIQATITSLTTQLDKWDANESRQIEYIETATETMERAFAKFEIIQDQLEEIDAESENPRRTQMQEAYDKARARVRKILRENDDMKISVE